MTRYVMGVNDEGRSYVVSRDELSVDGSTEVWNYNPEEMRDVIAGVADGVAAEWLEAAPGGAKWIYARMLPIAEQPEHPPMQGIDEDGFHTTRTIDFDVILDGEVDLILDEETVHLKGGDFVVIQAARHAWRNVSAAPASWIALLHTPV
jgi:hypothetical protein